MTKSQKMITFKSFYFGTKYCFSCKRQFENKEKILVKSGGKGGNKRYCVKCAERINLI